MKLTQPQSHIHRIKPGKVDQWRAWCTKINTVLRDWGIETLKQEGVVCEFFILFQIDDQYYTHGVTITGDGKKPGKAVLSEEINQEHFRNMQECLDLIGEGEPLYFLETR